MYVNTCLPNKLNSTVKHNNPISIINPNIVKHHKNGYKDDQNSNSDSKVQSRTIV